MLVISAVCWKLHAILLLPTILRGDLLNGSPHPQEGKAAYSLSQLILLYPSEAGLSLFFSKQSQDQGGLC